MNFFVNKKKKSYYNFLIFYNFYLMNKRSIIIGILGIIWSFIPSILHAGNVSQTDNVSLLVMDTSKLQKLRWDIKDKTSPEKQEEIIQTKVTTSKVIAKTNTKEIEKTMDEFKSLKRATLTNMVQAWWYDWQTDRTSLANEVGIKRYVWTLEQNNKIKNFLLSKIKIEDRKVPKTVPEIPKTSKQKKDMEQQPLFLYAKNRWYIREVDRTTLAEEAGIVDYVGDRDQNLKIKSYLKSKIKIE